MSELNICVKNSYSLTQSFKIGKSLLCERNKKMVALENVVKIKKPRFHLMNIALQINEIKVNKTLAKRLPKLK